MNKSSGHLSAGCGPHGTCCKNESSDSTEESSEARDLYEQVIAGYTSQLGADHTRTLDTKYNLVVLLETTGELEEAFRVCQDVVDGYALAYGAEHAETVDAKGMLERIQRAME